MKKVFLFVLVMVSVISVKAQDQALLAKWKFVKISDKGNLQINLSDVDGSYKKMFETARANDKDFTEEDSMMVAFSAKVIIDLFSGATMEFRNNGTYEFSTQFSMGGEKKKAEQGKYTVDAAARKIETVSEKGMTVSYVYELKEDVLLLINNRGKKEMIMTLEKVK